MSVDALDALRPNLAAIPANAVKIPTMSVEDYLGRCELLFTDATTDLATLSTAYGFDPTIIESLPLRTSALRIAEALWENVRYVGDHAKQVWKSDSPKAYDLRDSPRTVLG